MMVSTSIKRKALKKISGRDRLSELPDEILVKILSYLPITDAVKTVLIRRFGDLWTLVPSLTLYDNEVLKYNWCFAKFVRNVLLLHKRIPIDKFRFECEVDVYDDDDFESFENEVTTWIRVAIDGQVKQLKVGFRCGYVDVSRFPRCLPRCLFASPFLVELELVTCDITSLTHIEMRSLRKLSLVGVATVEVVIERLISGSPSLQELVLNDVYGVDNLQFTAPNIEKLDLHFHTGFLDCPNLKFLNIYTDSFPFPELVDVSSVCEVNIGSCHVNDEFVDLVEKLRNAQVFKFSDDFFQSSMDEELVELVIPQTTWKRLHIETRLQANQLLGLCKILSSSPHLEELVMYPHNWDKTHDHDMHSLDLPFPCSMQRLKTVTMRGYKVPCEGLLRLAEYFLKSSVTLDKMVILPNKNQVVLDEFKFVKQLLSFPRASTNARVIFGSDIY